MPKRSREISFLSDSSSSSTNGELPQDHSQVEDDIGINWKDLEDMERLEKYDDLPNELHSQNLLEPLLSDVDSDASSLDPAATGSLTDRPPNLTNVRTSDGRGGTDPTAQRPLNPHHTRKTRRPILPAPLPTRPQSATRSSSATSSSLPPRPLLFTRTSSPTGPSSPTRPSSSARSPSPTELPSNTFGLTARQLADHNAFGPRNNWPRPSDSEWNEMLCGPGPYTCGVAFHRGEPFCAPGSPIIWGGRTGRNPMNSYYLGEDDVPPYGYPDPNGEYKPTSKDVREDRVDEITGRQKHVVSEWRQRQQERQEMDISVKQEREDEPAEYDVGERNMKEEAKRKGKELA